MLSYQHAYHAGNLADVHKHALLAWMLDYMAQKPKALSYIETHAGRALYDLSAPEAEKTGEAAGGIARAGDWFDAGHPYARTLAATRAVHGPDAYPGSPAIAAHLLREGDRMRLAELHPQEHAALAAALGDRAVVEQRDGVEMARAVCPPDPARGLLLCDPSWEIRTDYETMPALFRRLSKRWPVGLLVLWYPLLEAGLHAPMVERLAADHPGALRSEVTFPPVRPGHRMRGSGLFVVNPPWGLAEEAERLAGRFATLG